MTEDYSIYFAPNYGEKKLTSDYTYLQHATINDKRGKVVETHNQFGYAITGNSCSDQFFCLHRAKASSRKGSVYDWIDEKGIDEWKRITLADCKNNNRKTTIEDCTPRDYLSSAQMRSTTACQFKPRIASLLMNEFEPTSVLDFASGWGDRCIGVMAKGKNYIGIDSNVNLKPAYDAMSARFEIHPTMLYQPSETVDYSKLEYDMIFTSPPYFTLEKYENMPNYTDYDQWVKTFLQPVIQNAFRHMKDNGWMCLNVPSKELDGRRNSLPIYESIVRFMGKPQRMIKMLLQNRVQKGKDGVVRPDKENKEYIYCWKKGIYEPVEEEVQNEIIYPEEDTVSITSAAVSITSAESSTKPLTELDILKKQYMEETDETKLKVLERKIAFFKTLV